MGRAANHCIGNMLNILDVLLCRDWVLMMVFSLRISDQVHLENLFSKGGEFLMGIVTMQGMHGTMVTDEVFEDMGKSDLALSG